MACDLCGSTAFEVLWDKTEREKQGTLRSVVIRDKEGNIVHGRNVICKNCGLVYVEPKMTKDELKHFYEEDYRRVYKTPENPDAEIRHAKTSYDILLDSLPPNLPNAKWLDVGCSTGRLIERVNGYGIEPSVENCEIAKSKGLNVENCAIEDYNPGIQFDIITMLNALEHVCSPTEVLRRLNSLLTDDGHVLISVPHLYGKIVHQPVDVFLSNAHLYAFSIPTITAYFSKCGFKVLKIYGVVEEIGEKLYVLGQKSEPEFVRPKFMESEIPVIRQHLAIWDWVYAVKEQIAKLGYK